METELASQIITGLPNFIFGGIAIYILWRTNNRLLDINERLCKRDDCTEKQAE